MNFAYTKYEIQPSSTNPSGIIHRPEVMLRVIGQTGDAHLMALLDTGADECVLPLSVGEAIGARLSPDETILASGVGGNLLELIPGDVEFELVSGEESYRWPVRVGFARFENPEDKRAILGPSWRFGAVYRNLRPRKSPRNLGSQRRLRGCNKVKLQFAARRVKIWHATPLPEKP